MYYKLRGNLFMNHNVNCDFLISFSKKFAKIVEIIIVLSTVQFEELEKKAYKTTIANWYSSQTSWKNSTV